MERQLLTPCYMPLRACAAASPLGDLSHAPFSMSTHFRTHLSFPSPPLGGSTDRSELTGAPPDGALQIRHG